MDLKKNRIHYVSGAIACIAIIAFVIILSIKKGDEDTSNLIESFESEFPSYDITELYGINIENYEIVRDKLAPNQLISDILLQYNVPQSVIHKVGLVSAKSYSVNKLRVNNNYTVFITKDSVPTARYLEYDIDRINYVVYAFNDSVYSYLGAREADTVYKTVSGTIESSLWNAMVDNGASTSLSAMLSDIYAWTVDFFGIQKGDKFNVLYEEVLVDGEAIGTGKILAADLNNQGTSYCAYYFDNSDVKGYFNEKGESLKKQFLKAPLQYKRISSGFSYNRKHPIYKTVRPHLGVDYAAPSGTPVHSVGNGTVIAKGWDKKGGGNYIKIKHNNVYTTVYMHLKGFASGVSVGTKVKQGQLIGYVGSTGAATGPHLDYRVFKNGKAINPLNLQPEPIEPIKKEDMQAFIEEVKQYQELF